MATNTALADASPEAVWDVLADGWCFSAWVVGCSHVRAVEAGWPAAGSRAHHAFGVWPFVIRDQTTIEEAVAPTRFVLSAQARPVGTARVTVTLAAEGAGTRVTMTEEAVAGPGRWVQNPLTDLVIRWRNREALARLVALAERRSTPNE